MSKSKLLAEYNASTLKRLMTQTFGRTSMVDEVDGILTLTYKTPGSQVPYVTLDGGALMELGRYLSKNSLTIELIPGDGTNLLDIAIMPVE